MDFKLVKNKWYTWKMLSGQDNETYLSPIKITDVKLSSDIEYMMLDFYNACHDNGSKDFSLKLKIVAHSKECLICKIDSEENNKLGCVAIIEEIDFEWFKNNITSDNVSTNLSIAEYLDKRYK